MNPKISHFYNTEIKRHRVTENKTTYESHCLPNLRF